MGGSGSVEREKRERAKWEKFYWTVEEKCEGLECEYRIGKGETDP